MAFRSVKTCGVENVHKSYAEYNEPLFRNKILYHLLGVGRDSLVGTKTNYGP